MPATKSNKLRFDIGSMVAPGDRLGSLRHNLIPGEGTYARGGHIFSCLVGNLTVVSEEEKSSKSDDNDKSTKTNNNNNIVSVVPSKKPAIKQVLYVGQLVLCRVQRITMLAANVEIIAAENVGKLLHNADATIRREDVRRQQSTSSTGNDDWMMESCFHPNDWVLGRIVSLGDARRYMISTAETELGVIRAFSSSAAVLLSQQDQLHFQDDESAIMKPISWKEMECPITGIKEHRKVAKPNVDILQKVLF